MKIGTFRGRYEFLSNFSGVFVEYAGIIYPTVEHAFQAAKTEDAALRKEFQHVGTAADAKYYGKRVRLRSDWDAVKVDIMHDLLRQKFSQEPYRTKLLATGDAYIEEGNTHGDRYWGTVKGEGKNTLGELIMTVREELANNA